LEDNGYFIKSLFKRQGAQNISALLASTIAPIVCAGLAGTHFGSEGLAIVAICAPIFLAASFFGFIISGGAQIICSAYIAKDELDTVNKIYSAAILLTLIINIIVCTVLLGFKTQLLTLMVGEISPQLSAYYNFFVLNAFFSMPVCIPMFFCKLVGRNEIGLILTGIIASVSIAASLNLINFMGIEAVALGQAIGTAAGLIVSFVMLSRHIKFRLPKKLYIKPIFKMGSPVGLTRLYILLTTLALNALFLRTGGHEALAVFGVISTLHRFNSAAIGGISQTLIPLVGVFNEERDVTSIRQTMKCAFFYGNLLMLIIGAALFVFRVQIAALFGLPAAGEFPAAIPFYAVYLLFLLNTTILSSYYNAAKRLTLANITAFLQEFAFLCAGAYLLAPSFGIDGIWRAYAVSGGATLLILFAILKTLNLRNRELTVPLLLNRRLEKEGRYISLSVDKDPEKVSEASWKITEFCEENNISNEQTMLIALSVEEIITLLINNSSSKNKRFSAAVRLFLMDGMTILRIRNVGEIFDAIEYYKNNIAGDFEKSLEVIGMKYIVDSASAIYYRQTFGVNSLVVIISD
jgi:Na+-driven multidrug efflux pump